MPKSTINFDAVRKIGLALPGAEEGTAEHPRSRFVENCWRACLLIVWLSRVRLWFVSASMIADAGPPDPALKQMKTECAKLYLGIAALFEAVDER